MPEANFLRGKQITIPSYCSLHISLPLLLTLVSILLLNLLASLLAAGVRAKKLIDMQTVTLQFSALADLVKFKNFIATDNIELNFSNLTIFCQCSVTELEKATSFYSATILSGSEKVISANNNSFAQ